MKPKLIILSDLWGKANSNWIAFYTDILEEYFEISYYDCCDLGEINTADYIEQNLHQQFVNGGIDTAVTKLCKLETTASMLLGFSIGGYIAWKASSNNLQTDYFYAISSTRLRKEAKKPSTNIHLYFGENDNYKPTDDWFKDLNIQQQLIPGEDHNFYKTQHFAEWLCKEIIQQITQ